MSADSDSEEFSDSLESRYSAQPCRASRKTKQRCRYMLIRPTDRRPGEGSHARNIQLQAASLQKTRKKSFSKSRAVLQQRLLSFQQRVAAEQSRRREQTQAQLDSLLQKFNTCRQLSKKQACELAGLEQQKASLQTELEQWRRVRPQTTADPERLQAQVKQLTHRLKNASGEMSKHSAANKSLRAQLDERDQTLKELHERVGVLERDVAMKRQLLEDLRCRIKICQDSEKSHRSVTEDLEKKMKSLADESTNRKALVDSLKRRLMVATAEKNQHETTSQKLKEELQRKEQRMAVLQARVSERDQAVAELERMASKHMQGLAEQSSQALETLMRKLSLAESRLQQFLTFTEALANHLAQDVQDAEACLRRKKKSEKERNQMSKCSLVKAASILNMTETDLVDMLDTDEIPSAGLLMDAMLVKMKEGKVLTEELAALTAAVSKNA